MAAALIMNLFSHHMSYLRNKQSELCEKVKIFRVFICKKCFFLQKQSISADAK